MKRIAMVIVAAGLALAAAGCDRSAPGGKADSVPQASAINMQAGDWEITTLTKISSAGMPEQTIPFGMTICVTKEDISNNTVVPQEAGCKVLSQKMTSNAYVAEFRCEDLQGGVSEGKQEITYGGTTYSGTSVASTTHKDGQKSQLTTSYSGRRLGDCTAKSLADRNALQKMAADAKKPLK